MKLKILSRILFIAFGLLFLMMLSLWQIQYISHAQSGITLTKVLNRSGNVVRVGERLNFIITLTNNSGFTLTNVNLIDTYDTSIMAFAEANPGADLVNSSTGIISWTNVAATPIPDGQSIIVTVVFTAEHPRTDVVNAVRAQDIRHGAEEITYTVETSRTNEAIGGNAPVVKFLAPGATPEAGLPVTFTHIITNDGAALMTHLPLTDTYDPTYLEFLFAVPPPNITSPPGLLVWNDLTDYFGDIQADTAVVITTVFSATTQVLNTTNHASTAGARDQYDNNLTAGAAQVPITIIGEMPTPTPEEDSDNDNDNDNEDDTSAPAPTATAAVVTSTPAAVITSTPGLTVTTDTTAGPKYLPETGQFPPTQVFALLAGLILIVTGWYLKKINNDN